MPAEYPTLAWFQYHLGTKEWKKATADLVALLAEDMIEPVEFDIHWHDLGGHIKEASQRNA